MRKCAVGGQAVMEGVMMKSDKGIAMAVRRADGKIVASYKNQVSKAQKGTFWGLPVIRGVVALVESLTTGMSTTMDSAKMYGEDAFADEEPTKFEKWLAKTFGKSVEKIAITVALVLGVALAVGLFVLLPQLISSMIFGQTKSLWRSLVEGVLRVGIYIGYLFGCSCIKDMKRLFMYHGAEHKTIACYEAEDELIPARAKKYSRLHPRCGTNYLFLVMAISILFLTVIDAVFIYGFKFEIQNSILEFLFRFGVRIICIPLIAGISYEVLRAAAKSDGWFAKVVRAPGMGLQLITTKEPTEDMLEVAIAAFCIAMGERSCDYYNKLADEPENPQPADAAEPHENAEAAEAENTEGAGNAEPEAKAETAAEAQ